MYSSKLCYNIYLQDNVPVTIKEPVPQQFVHLLTGKHGRDNFRVIEKECGVKITWPKFSGTEKHVVFNMKGLRSNCEHAKETLRASMVSIYIYFLSVKMKQSDWLRSLSERAGFLHPARSETHCPL